MKNLFNLVLGLPVLVVLLSSSFSEEPSRNQSIKSNHEFSAAMTLNDETNLKGTCTKKFSTPILT